MSIDTRPPVAKAARRAGPAPEGRRSGFGALNAGAQGLLVVWALVCVVPLLWAVLTSFKSDREIFTNPWALPTEWHFDNFVRAWTSASIGRYFINSAIVVSAAVLLVMLLGAMVAYVLARYEFRGRNVIYYAFVVGMTFPLILALVPLFFVVQNVGMLGTYHGLVIAYIAYALPFTVFFLTNSFRTLPGELIEAAMLDGCSHAGAFFRIMLPLARPGMISVGILNFFGLWNQFYLPLVLMPDQDRYVLSQGLAVLAANQGYRSDWSALFAGLVIALVPVLAVYVAFQRRIQDGLAVGAVK
ncbi:carbohydrate ABC transporter permease [Pseudonocardia sp. DSM 110487]|jgi:N-acetylglucosamine transport system permease protein|uniref:carbohydrate ABC transporter permease n=1 Tax=Pseudonocardia sp. DSM 110487 TaxID=2865833 RepID=UPI001C696D1E|nr:carbohydrate ABC transporter permease [Pseudonocardia sp. DSM 110487]QYN36066.1 carbohydrate ABC transporter permease [Pseudonocardia sp. DSM 110487]